MRKTTVYLSDEEAESLRQMAAATGSSQAELIRQGVQRIIKERPRRTFHSMGKGASGGALGRRWSSEELYEKAFGDR